MKDHFGAIAKAWLRDLWMYYHVCLFGFDFEHRSLDTLDLVMS